jgi:hypothetical protein
MLGRSIEESFGYATPLIAFSVYSFCVVQRHWFIGGNHPYHSRKPMSVVPEITFPASAACYMTPWFCALGRLGAVLGAPHGAHFWRTLNNKLQKWAPSLRAPCLRHTLSRRPPVWRYCFPLYVKSTIELSRNGDVTTYVTM